MVVSRTGLKMAKLRHCAMFRRKRLNRGQNYGDFSILEDGGRRHLGFSKFQIFNGRRLQDGRTASPCQIMSK